MEAFEENVNDLSQTFDDSELVEAVVLYPALYDMKLPQYHNTSVKSRCWELVSQKVNRPVDICMARWIRLKDNFRREKNKRELESRSGQGLSQRKGFALYASMGFMHAHLKKRQSFTNVKSAPHSVAKKTNPSSQSTPRSTPNTQWGEQYQYMLPMNPPVSWTSTTALQDQFSTISQRVQNTPAYTSWDHVPQPQTLNYPDSSLSTLPVHKSTPVWIPPTTVPILCPTVNQSLDTISTSPEIINTNALPALNVTQPAITFATPTVVTESTIISTAPTILTEPRVIPITSTPAVKPIVTPTFTTPIELNRIRELPIAPSPPARTHTPMTIISTPNIRVPQCSSNTMLTLFNPYNPAMSPSTSTSSSPAPPSPADSLYSSVYSDISCEFNVEEIDTVQTRKSFVTAQRDMPMKSASASLTSTSLTLNNKNHSPATPKGCYTKDSVRRKKLDPLEECMISLSNSIKGKLEAEPERKQAIRTPNQVFGDMVAVELSRMDDAARATTKSLIVDILFARQK